MKMAKPLVYSCSGCSSAAQMANFLAIRLDRSGVAQMSCIAGVGGGVHFLVQLAKKSEFIISLDGCSLKCCQACLSRHGLKSKLPIVLSEYKVEKKLHEDFSVEKATQVLTEIESRLALITDFKREEKS